jgi:hypothetical protein
VWLKVEIEKKRKKEAIVKERILSFGIQRRTRKTIVTFGFLFVRVWRFLFCRKQLFKGKKY